MLEVYIHKNHFLLIRLQAVLNITSKEKNFWFIWKRRKLPRKYMDGLLAVLKLKLDYKVQQRKESKWNRSIHKFKRISLNATLKSNNRSISKFI